MTARLAVARRAIAGGLIAVAALLASTVAAPQTTDPRSNGGPTAPPPSAPSLGAPGPATPGVPGAAQPGTAPQSGADAAPTEDIRDIRGPKYIANPWLIPEIIAGIVVLGLAGYGLWRWRARRKRPRPLSHFERALAGLEALRPIMQPAHAREFSIAATDIVRGYIEERFSVIASHRTTEEFLHDLLSSTNASLARHRGLLAEFLNQTDLVKFAGVSLSTTTMESLHHSARAFVLETAKPDPEPVPAAAAAPAKAAPKPAKPGPKP